MSSVETGGAGAGAGPRFLADRMLGKLGAYLRILGYDARDAGTLATRALVACARHEARILLTRNRRLVRDHPGLCPLLVRADEPVRQLAEVVAAFGLDPRARLFSRCIRCNVDLLELAELGLDAARVPEGVRARHERFWKCPSCATVFWKGAHVEHTCKKLEDVLGRAGN